MRGALPPVTYAIAQTPCVQWREKATEREIVLQSERALAFMDDDQRDLTILQAGLVASEWSTWSLDQLDKKQLDRDIDRFTEVFHRHQPSKFKQLAPLMAFQEKQEAIASSRPVVIRNDLSNGFLPTSNSTQINTQINQWIFTNNRTIQTATTQGNWTSVNNTFLQWWIDEYQPERMNEEVARQNAQVLLTHQLALASGTTAPVTQLHSVNTVNMQLAITNAHWYTSQVEAMENRSYSRGTGLCWQLKRVAGRLQAHVPATSKRRVVKRQLDLLGSVLSKPGDVNVFLKGETLEIESKTSGLKYRFTRREHSRSINQLVEASHASTPYQLEVYSQDNIYLTSLCVYVKKTPALDQLAAMIMYIQSGEEAQLLETGNFYSVGDSERLNQELQRLGLLKTAPTYSWAGRTNNVPLPQLEVQEDTEEMVLARNYPKIVGLRSLVRDYYFLKLFNKETVH